MDFELSAEQAQIREQVERVCARFDDAYWLDHDRSGVFPEDFYAAMAEGNWLGIAMPEEYGGAGLGITEASIMMQAVAQSGACMSGASAIHINIFGLNPVVVHGTEEQKRRMLPPLIQGRDKACFGVTEPNAGLNTTEIAVRAGLNTVPIRSALENVTVRQIDSNATVHVTLHAGGKAEPANF